MTATSVNQSLEWEDEISLSIENEDEISLSIEDEDEISMSITDFQCVADCADEIRRKRDRQLLQREERE